MRLIALYKTWDGEEWIGPSLASIYQHVDAIVMVHSSRSWLGETGNTCEPVARKWCAKNDVGKKVHHVNVAATSQEEQYAAGIHFIADHKILFDVIMAIDADEIWDGKYLDAAKAQMASDIQRIPAYRCSMQTFIKLPFLRVEPPWGMPTTFFRDPKLLTMSPRGCRAPATDLQNVWMHHFTYVRRSEEVVFRKIHQSCIADTDEIIVPKWREEVWNKLPAGYRLHAFSRWRDVWDHVEPVWFDCIPEDARQVADSFLPPNPDCMAGEEMIMKDIAWGKPIVVELGTRLGRCAAIFSIGAGYVHTYDVFEDIFHLDCKADQWGQGGLYRDLYAQNPFTEQAVRENLRLFANVTLHRKLTTEGASDFVDRTVDLVFVDADHSYAGVSDDCAAWRSKLKPGGIMLFHDNSDLHPNVRKFCDDLKASGSDLRPHQLPENHGTLRAFMKQ